MRRKQASNMSFLVFFLWFGTELGAAPNPTPQSIEQFKENKRKTPWNSLFAGRLTHGAPPGCRPWRVTTRIWREMEGGTGTVAEPKAVNEKRVFRRPGTKHLSFLSLLYLFFPGFSILRPFFFLSTTEFLQNASFPHPLRNTTQSKTV